MWPLNSGAGQLGYTADGYAVVGLSRPRESSSLSGLALDAAQAERDAEARCGIHIIDLATGATTDWLRIDRIVLELYDVVTLPGAVRPILLGLRTDEIRHSISIDTTT